MRGFSNGEYNLHLQGHGIQKADIFSVIHKHHKNISAHQWDKCFVWVHLYWIIYTNKLPLIPGAIPNLFSISPVINCHFWHRQLSGSIVKTVSCFLVLTIVDTTATIQNHDDGNVSWCSTIFSWQNNNEPHSAIPSRAVHLVTGSFPLYPVIFFAIHILYIYSLPQGDVVGQWL